MATEDEKRRVRELLGGKLRAYREGDNIPVTKVAKESGVGRQYVYLVEDGTANFNINRYVDMLRACGVPFEEAIAGLRTSDIPAAHQRDHELLSTILNSGIDELLQGIRVPLEAIAEKALRLQKARASPRSRAEHGSGRGPSAGSAEKRSRKKAV